MNKASGPNPWANNRHAVGSQSAQSSHRPRTDSSSGQKTGQAWGPRADQRSAPRSWSPGGGAAAQRKLIGPPYAFLAVSFAAAFLALCLTVLASGLVVFGVAWALAGFIGFGAAVLFVQRDALRQTEVFYLRDPRAPWIYRFAIVLSLIAVVVTAVRVALVVGRMG